MSRILVENGFSYAGKDMLTSGITGRTPGSIRILWSHLLPGRSAEDLVCMYLSLNNRFIQKLSELLIVNHFFAKNTVAYFFSKNIW